MADPVLKWYIVDVFKDGGVYYDNGVRTFSGGSRTDPNALDIWALQAGVFAQGISPYNTNAEAAAAAAAMTVEEWGNMLDYIPQRVSYPELFGGPRDVYLPDVSPDFAQYPYTVQGYTYAFTAFRGLDSPLSYTTLVIASGLSAGDAIPPNPPDPEDPEHIADVTIQLKRDNTQGIYTINPSDASVLTKYGSGVRKIRAKFATTRVAIMEETMAGGFMIYEEVALAAISPVYVYNGNRRLVEITTAALIPQYRVS